MINKESEELIELIKKETLTEVEEKRLDYLQHEFKSSKIKEFLNLFVKPFLPSVKSIGNYTIGSPRTIHRHAQLDEFQSNHHFNRSNYQLRLTANQRLIHYTSLSTLMNIVREGKIRLHSMNHKVDPGEVIHASKIMGYKDSTMQELRKQLFCMSFVINDENNSEVFDHWRLYGLDGEGVGIVFSVDTKNIGDWFHFHLSKIHYETPENNPFNKKALEIDNWQIQQGFQVRNTHKLFSKLFAFHKSNIFSSENEVRLLNFEKHNLFYGGNKDSKKVFLDINKFGQESYYTELGLGNIYINKYKKFKEGPLKDYHKMIPKLKIEKIILGYGNSWKMGGFEKMETIRKQARLTLGYDIEFERSIFSNHFE